MLASLSRAADRAHAAKQVPAGCWLASILPSRVGPPDLGLLRSPAADHSPQQLLGSGGGNSALPPA